jgi:hypothetical protein
VTDAPDSPARERGDGRVKRAGQLGRRIAIGLYLVAVTYMVVVGFNSVIRQVFFPPLPAEAQALSPLGPTECAAELESLRRALLDQASAHLASSGRAPAAPWLEDWDHRHRVLAHRCPATGPSGEALAVLQRLRYRIETTLRRFDREEARLSVRARELISAEAAEPSGASPSRDATNARGSSDEH